MLSLAMHMYSMRLLTVKILLWLSNVVCLWQAYADTADSGLPDGCAQDL